MSIAVLDRKSLLISVIIITLLISITGGMAVYLLSDPGIKQSFIITRTAKIIDQNYYEAVNWDKMISSGRSYIFDRLDRFSSYVEPVQFDWMDTKLSGSYSGIGVTVVGDEQGLMILSARENGPADKAGLLTGDIIMAADSVDISGLSFNKAATMLRGEEGTTVMLTVFRPVTKDTTKVAVVRSEIEFVRLPYAGLTDDSAIYMRLLDFDAGASDEIKAALDSLREKLGDTRPLGVILDLRGNPGGLFDEARKTADIFLDKGSFIVGTNGRSRWYDTEHYAKESDRTDGLPMVVLTDGGSASASEIVAGALQKEGRALIVGDTTFGKGLVQGFFRFPDGDGLRLTISRYYLSGGFYLNNFDSVLNDVGSGLIPDHIFKTDDQGRFPAWLERSLLLSRYASLYQDDIINAKGAAAYEQLISNLVTYAQQEESEFKGEISLELEYFTELSKIEVVGTNVTQSINQLRTLSKNDDLKNYFRHSDYIVRRLKRLAYERKEGMWAAYDKAMIRDNPIIEYAEQLLAGNM